LSEAEAQLELARAFLPEGRRDGFPRTGGRDRRRRELTAA
jgi:hypothetical protein